MDIKNLALPRDEEAVLALRSLYESHGYTKYRMSKFEEYDFYAGNRSFLRVGSILTFTDLSGRLMALKPDITLSIVKNARKGQTEKVYYNENVYRPDAGGREFREIMQVGLECIGPKDAFTTAEVIFLAESSLKLLSSGSVLDVSHMGLMLGLLDESGLSARPRAMALELISHKSAHELAALCAENGVRPEMSERLAALCAIYGPFETAFAQALTLDVNDATHAALDELRRVFALVRAMGGGDTVRLDFSIASDMNYYNGVIFQGFIEGAPAGVLSGGRYDRLLPRFGLDEGAVGFAVYLGLIERFLTGENGFDAEALLLYNDDDDPMLVARKAAQLRREYGSVRVQKSGGQMPRCRRTIIFSEDADE